MAKKKRELLKFREGDVGLKIRKDGQLELAGLDQGMIRKDGMVNPAVLFAAIWARRDVKTIEACIINFKEAVKEGYFGEEAKREYIQADKLQQEKDKPPFMNPDAKMETPKVPSPVLDPDSKPSVSLPSLGNEFETHSDVIVPSTEAVGPSSVGEVASGAVTFEQPAPLTDGGCGNADSDSGAVTFEQPKPYDVNGMLKGRDS